METRVLLRDTQIKSQTTKSDLASDAELQKLIENIDWSEVKWDDIFVKRNPDLSKLKMRYSL